MSRMFKLWTGEPIDPAKIPLPDQIVHRVIQRPEKEFRFLLGADIAAFGGTLFCGWGNSRKDENDRHSAMRGRHSSDGGLSWSECERISPPPERGFSCSHGVFFPHNGRLHAFVPQARYGRAADGDAYPELRTLLMTLSPDGVKWEFSGIAIPEPFWPMAQPHWNASGNCLLPGIRCTGNNAFPAVAISDGSSLDRWRIVEIPQPGRPRSWGEGGILVNGNEVVFVFRNGWENRPRARIAFSRDGGESWSAAVDTNLQMSPAKPCCGTLSDGRGYLVFNPAPDGRDTLAVALTAPGEHSFRAIRLIRRGKSPAPRYQGFGKVSQWAYPSACEQDGKLWIAYASSKEECVLSTLPLDTLS